MDGSVIDSDWFYNDYIEGLCKEHGVSARIISDDELKLLRKMKWAGGSLG